MSATQTALETRLIIHPLPDQADIQEARRVFKEFSFHYQAILTTVGDYLEQVSDTMPEFLSGAYRPWCKATRDLMSGVYLTAQRIPLPNPDDFAEALAIFSLASASRFLRDVCISCKLAIHAGWAECFHRNVSLLLQAYKVIMQAQTSQRARG